MKNVFILLMCLGLCLLTACGKTSEYNSCGEGVVRSVGTDSITGERVVSLIVSHDVSHLVYLDKSEKTQVNKGDLVTIEVGKLIHHLPAEKIQEKQ